MHPTAPAPDRFPTPAGQVRPLGGFAVAASVLIVASALAWAVVVHIAGWTWYGSVATFRERFAGAPGVYATGIRPIKDAVIRLGIVALFSAVAGVVFLAWLVRARRTPSCSRPCRIGSTVGGRSAPGSCRSAIS